MRKAIVIVLILVALGAAGAYVFAEQNAKDQATFEILRQAEVQRDTIQATVGATGSIEPEALVSLTFGTSGTVQQLSVVRGQQVEAGDVLATLNSSELALLLQQAQDSLRIQELTLAQRVNSEVSVARLAGAQADVMPLRGTWRSPRPASQRRSRGVPGPGTGGAAHAGADAPVRLPRQKPTSLPGAPNSWRCARSMIS
jgi:multidrug efflux pump subunit AcrA (membrane-fusion protein)